MTRPCAGSRRAASPWRARWWGTTSPRWRWRVARFPWCGWTTRWSAAGTPPCTPLPSAGPAEAQEFRRPSLQARRLGRLDHDVAVLHRTGERQRDVLLLTQQAAHLLHATEGLGDH